MHVYGSGDAGAAPSLLLGPCAVQAWPGPRSACCSPSCGRPPVSDARTLGHEQAEASWALTSITSRAFGTLTPNLCWPCSAGPRAALLCSRGDCWFPGWQAAQVAQHAPRCQVTPNPSPCALHELLRWLPCFGLECRRAIAPTQASLPNTKRAILAGLAATCTALCISCGAGCPDQRGAVTPNLTSLSILTSQPPSWPAQLSQGPPLLLLLHLCARPAPAALAQGAALVAGRGCERAPHARRSRCWRACATTSACRKSCQGASRRTSRRCCGPSWRRARRAEGCARCCIGASVERA